MIVILYPSGGFGTTIEYCLKNFSQEHGPLGQGIGKNSLTTLRSTGSMHSYQKDFHIHHIEHINVDAVDSIGIKKRSNINFLSSIYPLVCSFNQNEDVSVQRAFNAHKTYTLDNHVIMVKFKDIKDIEIAHLMRYEKIPLPLVVSSVSLECCRQWNPNVNSVMDLERWQLRELLSIQFNNNIQDLLDVERYADDHWLVVDIDEILNDLSGVINKSMEYVGWTKNNEDLDAFSTNWAEKQKIITNRLEKIESIVSKTLADEELNWGELQLIDQVLIQARLLRQGYEIKCDGLNIFPTNSVELIKLLVNA